MPLSDSSQTYMRAVWPRPSPAVLRLTFAAGVCEVSRFSCMKFLGVSGVFDYAGLSGCSRYRACSCCLPHITRASASGLTVYGAEYTPRLSSVYASLSTSRYPAQDSRPSGSLLLSRKALSSSASCRFIPAHCNRLVTPVCPHNHPPECLRDYFFVLQEGTWLTSSSLRKITDSPVESVHCAGLES